MITIKFCHDSTTTRKIMIHFEKQIWKQDYVSNKSRSAWRCSNCGMPLQLEKEIKKSKRFTGSGILSCSNENCSTVYHFVGIQIPFANGYEVSSTYYKIDEYRLYPTQFQLELHLFKLSEALSNPIKEKLILSFNHFWYDLDACANKIRQALELILEEMGASGNTLGHKIESVESKIGSELCAKIMALKWIGNEGSHSEKPFTKEQILTTIELLVDVLNQLYPDETETMRKREIVKSVNDNKGIK
ncbi:DUF4145 domain-containing protein [Reichenbachiella sp.]|uniref:DUF4145 domain-containing protein n=1 Tax=Reichenbachiella sp. TaxID=2184521 RepID=UPI00329A740D